MQLCAAQAPPTPGGRPRATLARLCTGPYTASMILFAVDSADLATEVAFVTDGQLSGLCLKGITVAEVSPEAAVGGPLALVQDGDEITIDADAPMLDLHVDEEELARRREALGAPELPRAGGYLSIYQRSGQPMSTGAVLVEND
jgi:dihydroxy-acid dehydratase